MGMAAGGGSNEVNSEINVTPMIDVLLVLLIIFMIVQALSRTAVEIVIPPTETGTVTPSTSNQIVLEMRDDGSNWINGQGPFGGLAAVLSAAVPEVKLRLRQGHQGPRLGVIRVNGDRLPANARDHLRAAAVVVVTTDPVPPSQ